MIQCRVPASIEPRTVTIQLETSSGFYISERAIDFVYKDLLIAIEIIPIKGSLEGGYPFTILGDFDLVVLHGLQTLWWGEDDITDRVTNI